jgi:hypothetical protein
MNSKLLAMEEMAAALGGGWTIPLVRLASGVSIIK